MAARPRAVTERMKAVVFHGPGDVRVEVLPTPGCEPGELRVRVDACAVCGSDLKAWKSGNPRIRPPMTMGHEFTGLVESIGEGTAGFRLGDRVVMATSVSCGECAYCRKGHPNLCGELAPMGFSYPGGMAEFVTIPALAIRNGHVIPVPSGMPAEWAALAEPLSCCVNAAENCGVQAGDTVVVIGAGPMGILNACVAREFGARQVILAETNPFRLDQARDFGFDRLINPGREALGEAVRQATGGIGADVAIVAAPAVAPQEEAPALVRKRGCVCLFASLPKERAAITLDSRTIHYGELRLVGSSDSTPAQVARAVAMLADSRFPASRLVTHELGLARVHEAFQLMERGEALRVVLKPERNG